MKSPTYYDILGVSRDATLEEITAAKNALAKVYHPDANVHKDIDTTAFMQEILEAYHVLSDEKRREEYNRETFGGSPRVFKTFTVGPEDDSEESSFVTYWNAASQLNETIDKSVRLMERKRKKVFPSAFSPESAKASSMRNLSATGRYPGFPDRRFNI